MLPDKDIQQLGGTGKMCGRDCDEELVKISV